jgi:hypothetical protein
MLPLLTCWSKFTGMPLSYRLATPLRELLTGHKHDGNDCREHIPCTTKQWLLHY